MDRTPKSGELYRYFKGGIFQVIVIAVHSETGEQLVVYQAMYGEFHVYAKPLSMFNSVVDDKKYPQAAQRNQFEKIERHAAASQTVYHTQTGQEAYHGAAGQEAYHAQAGAAGQEAYHAQAGAAGQEAYHAQAGAAGQEAYYAQAGAAGRAVQDNRLQPGEATAAATNMPSQKPRVQSPAESKRGFRLDEEISDTESDYYKRRRRQIEEREHRREQFRKPQKHESATDELRANPSLLKFLDTDTYEEKFQVLNEIQDDMTDRLIDDIAVVLDVVIPEGPINDRYHQLRNIILTRQKYETNRFR